MQHWNVKWNPSPSDSYNELPWQPGECDMHEIWRFVPDSRHGGGGLALSSGSIFSGTLAVGCILGAAVTCTFPFWDVMFRDRAQMLSVHIWRPVTDTHLFLEISISEVSVPAEWRHFSGSRRMRELGELGGAAWVYSLWGVVILQGQYASDVNLQPKRCRIRKTARGTSCQVEYVTSHVWIRRITTSYLH